MNDKSKRKLLQWLYVIWAALGPASLIALIGWLLVGFWPWGAMATVFLILGAYPIWTLMLYHMFRNIGHRRRYPVMELGDRCKETCGFDWGVACSEICTGFVSNEHHDQHICYPHGS